MRDPLLRGAFVFVGLVLVFTVAFVLAWLAIDAAAGAAVDWLS